jgi:hypothetical protein
MREMNYGLDVGFEHCMSKPADIRQSSLEKSGGLDSPDDRFSLRPLFPFLLKRLRRSRLLTITLCHEAIPPRKLRESQFLN